MSPESFPEVVWGPCPICGGTQEATTDADAAVRDESIGWMVLTYYPPLDLYMCDICIENQESDDQSILDNEKHVEEEVFREKAGFTTDNSDEGVTI